MVLPSILDSLLPGTLGRDQKAYQISVENLLGKMIINGQTSGVSLSGIGLAREVLTAILKRDLQGVGAIDYGYDATEWPDFATEVPVAGPIVPLDILFRTLLVNLSFTRRHSLHSSLLLLSHLSFEVHFQPNHRSGSEQGTFRLGKHVKDRLGNDYFVLSPELAQIKYSGLLKLHDAEFSAQLKLPLARRLYRLLSEKFLFSFSSHDPYRHVDMLLFDTSRLARVLGLYTAGPGGGADTADLNFCAMARRLLVAENELVTAGYLAPVLIDDEADGIYTRAYWALRPPFLRTDLRNRHTE